MNILAITPDTWYLALISVGVVFSILFILVLILSVFTWIAKKTANKARKVKESQEQYKQAKSFANASDEDKAAVAVALYLYELDEKRQESRVLTITHKSQAWSSVLNPRM